MKEYDFRFDKALIQSLIGKKMIKYKHAEFIYTNTVTETLGFEVDNSVFELNNDFVKIDYLSIDDEATIFSIFKSNWNKVESMINDDINETIINEKIKKIILVNDHTLVNINEKIEYDMWDTKAIIFFFENYEICFAKEDCWFSQQIEVYKGHDLIEKISNGKELVDDFNLRDSKNISVVRFLDEIIK